MFLPRHNTPRLYCKAPPAKAALSVADKVDAHTTMFSRYGSLCCKLEMGALLATQC